MKRFFTLLLTALVTLSVSAQFSDGYYRLQCKETGRYLTVHNDYVNKEAAKRTGQVELQSLETVEDFDKIVGRDKIKVHENKVEEYKKRKA